MIRKSKGEYDVGKGKPPKQSRFKPGQSGNPSGRPKGRTNHVTELREEMARTVQVNSRGKAETITVTRAVFRTVIQQVLASGNTLAMARLFNVGAQLGAFGDHETPQSEPPLSDLELALFSEMLTELEGGEH